MAISRKAVTYSIRFRERANTNRKRGEVAFIGEWQVMHGNRVIGRYDTEAQAAAHLKLIRESV